MFRKKTNRFACCFENETCNSTNHTRQNLSNFLPMFFNAPPTPFPRLDKPFLRLLTITPITKPTADTTANTVKPYFLKIALTRSLRLIRSSICSFSASSLEISFCCSSILASICSLWFTEAVSRESFNSFILFSRLEISSSFVLIISSAGVPRASLIVFGFFFHLLLHLN